MKVYFIPGLGADETSFQFLDLSFCEPQYITWPVPLKNETLPAYSERLWQQINDENAHIVGLSFGGMLAVEMAKNHPGIKASIIASAKTKNEIPFYLRMWRYFPVYKMLPQKTHQLSGRIVIRIFGAIGEKQKIVQQKILKKTNPAFSRWAMDAIVNWKNETIPENVFHIHGSSDKLLPHHFMKVNHIIEKGEHVMVMDRADEISILLKKHFST